MKKYQKNNDEISLKKILISFFYLLIIIIVIIFIKNNLITEIYMNIQDYKKITKLNYEIDSNAECKKYEFEGEKDIPQYYNVICGYNGSKTINNETGVILKNIKVCL